MDFDILLYMWKIIKPTRSILFFVLVYHCWFLEKDNKIASI